MEVSELIKHLDKIGLTPKWLADNDYRGNIFPFSSDSFSGEAKADYRLITGRLNQLRELPDCWSLPEYKSLRQKEDEIFQTENARLLGKLAGVRTVEVHGGGEGDGEHFHIVIYFPLLDIYLRSDGTYYSYVGVEDVGDWYQVVPKEKIVVFYERP